MKKNAAHALLNLPRKGQVQQHATARSESRQTSVCGTIDDHRQNGVVIGTLTGFDEKGHPLVEHPKNSVHSPIAAKTTVRLGADHIDQPLALLFEGGDYQKPVVLGLLQPNRVPLELAGHQNSQRRNGKHFNLTVDGQRLVIEADREIVLRCGSASIRLCKNGRVIVRGKNILSRSTGLNRIKGGAVQIN